MPSYLDAISSTNIGNRGWDEVLHALGKSLVVRLIMSRGLEECSANDSAEEVLRNPSHQEYSQLPVRRDGRIVGVLVRGPHPQNQRGPVCARMQPLREGDIVSADMAIGNFIERAAAQAFHLVVDDAEIVGIVTESDLLKLPVRLHLFTLLSHLETTMLDFIQSKYCENVWKKALSKGRLQKAEEERRKDQLANRNMDLVYYIQLRDKRDIICKLDGVKEGALFKQDLKDLEKLRNRVVHATDYPKEASQLRCATRKARRWIEDLNQ